WNLSLDSRLHQLRRAFSAASRWLAWSAAGLPTLAVYSGSAASRGHCGFCDLCGGATSGLRRQSAFEESDGKHVQERPGSARLWCRFACSMTRQLCEEARAVGNFAAEVFPDGLAHVGEGSPHAEIHCCSTSGRVCEDGNVFAGVIGGRPARVRITTVVCGDHQQIGKTEQRQKVAQHAVKLFERFGKSFHVFAVAVQHVEVHEVAENQSVFSFFRGCG